MVGREDVYWVTDSLAEAPARYGRAAVWGTTQCGERTDSQSVVTEFEPRVPYQRWSERPDLNRHRKLGRLLLYH